MSRERRRAQRLARITALLWERIAGPLLLLVAKFVAGTLGFFALGVAHERPWSLLDCAYMASITLSTVGYGDVLGTADLPVVRVYTMTLIVLGLGATLYSVSALTAFIVEGHLKRMFEEEEMENRIERLSGHTIICGVGRTGITVAEEHAEEGKPFVVIDRDQQRIGHLAESLSSLLWILGDATSEEVLERAGIERAGSLVAALGDDKANMYLVVTARFRRKDLRIVVKCLDHDAARKFLAGGADHVVSPAHIGGRRIAGHVLRPGVLDFLDSVLRRSEAGVGAVEVVVEEGSALAERTLGDAALQEKVGLPVVALRHPGERHFVYAPDPKERLRSGTAMVVIGPADRVERLQALARP
ncbi:MAG: potassium channel protein [Deltaproteobacteria bacterium]|nr:potassium channel protein [Deltaproteobacteria bacterium]